MELMNSIIKTRVARSGMTLVEALKECVDMGVPGIPYVDSNDRIIGRFSMRHAFLHLFIPDDMVQGAHLLSNTPVHIDIPKLAADKALDLPVDEMILPSSVHLNPTSPTLKALALMERLKTDYLFLTEDNYYHGVVTRLGIVKLILETREGIR